MPRVEDSNLASFALAPGPRKRTLMDCELKGLANRGGYDHRGTWRAERGSTIFGGQHRCEMCVYGAPAANVRNHHSFLHRPGILAVDETLNSAVTVVFPDRVGIVYRLALGEQGVLRGPHGQMFTRHKKGD